MEAMKRARQTERAVATEIRSQKRTMDSPQDNIVYHRSEARRARNIRNQRNDEACFRNHNNHNKNNNKRVASGKTEMATCMPGSKQDLNSVPFFPCPKHKEAKHTQEDDTNGRESVYIDLFLLEPNTMPSTHTQVCFTHYYSKHETNKTTNRPTLAQKRITAHHHHPVVVQNDKYEKKPFHHDQSTNSSSSSWRNNKEALQSP